MNMTRMFALSTTKSDSSEDNDDEDEISDARLPPFVCEQLDRMRNAKTEEGTNTYISLPTSHVRNLTGTFTSLYL